MATTKTYTTEVLSAFNDEANKYIEQQKSKLTADSILLQSKKTALELIKAGCNATELAKIYQAAGIEVSINKIRQLYFKSKKAAPLETKQPAPEKPATRLQDNS